MKPGDTGKYLGKSILISFYGSYLADGFEAAFYQQFQLVETVRFFKITLDI